MAFPRFWKQKTRLLRDFGSKKTRLLRDFANKKRDRARLLRGFGTKSRLACHFCLAAWVGLGRPGSPWVGLGRLGSANFLHNYGQAPLDTWDFGTLAVSSRVWSGLVGSGRVWAAGGGGFFSTINKISTFPELDRGWVFFVFEHHAPRKTLKLLRQKSCSTMSFNTVGKVIELRF